MKYFDETITEDEISLDDKSNRELVEKQVYQDYLRTNENVCKQNSFDNKHLEKAFTNKTYRKAMKNISQDEKDVLYFYVVECKSLKDVCEELNKSKCEVLRLKKLAVKHFKNNLAKYKNTNKKNGGVVNE